MQSFLSLYLFILVGVKAKRVDLPLRILLFAPHVHGATASTRSSVLFARQMHGAASTWVVRSWSSSIRAAAIEDEALIRAAQGLNIGSRQVDRSRCASSQHFEQQ